MSDFEQINIERAKEIIDKGDMTIVDIRDPESFKTGHIEHAISVNDENVESFIENADKNKPLICYCYRGVSSQGAAQFFQQKGFKNVYSIDGGFEEWKTVYSSVSSESH